MQNNNNSNISVVDNLILDFFKCSPTINVNTVNKLSWNDQKTFLNSTFHHELLKKYPVNDVFAKTFLKKIIHSLEVSSEVHDNFYTCLCELMNTEHNANNMCCYRHYLINNNLKNIITIKESKNMVVNGTTGMRTWEAAIILADWALANKELFLNKNVLELGSGIGFTGITISKYGNPKAFFFTDCHQDVLDTICTNIEINFPNTSKVLKENIISYLNENNNFIGVMNLDWTSFKALPDFIIPDIVIGADIIYDPSILQPLFNVFSILFVINPKVNIFILSIIRNRETNVLFLKLFDECEFYYESINFDIPTHLDWSCDTEKCFIRIKKR